MGAAISSPISYLSCSHIAVDRGAAQRVWWHAVVGRSRLMSQCAISALPSMKVFFRPVPNASRGSAACGAAPGRNSFALAHAFPRTLNLVGRYLDEINKGPQWRRHKPPSRIIEIRSRERLPPGFEDRLERAAFKVWAQPVLEQRHDAGARDRGVDEEIGGAAETHRQRPRH